MTRRDQKCPQQHRQQYSRARSKSRQAQGSGNPLIGRNRKARAQASKTVAGVIVFGAHAFDMVKRPPMRQVLAVSTFLP
jgi:hypothetical protein